MTRFPRAQKKKQALSNARPVADAPSPSPPFSTSTSSSSSLPPSFSPPDPTAPFPGGGAWLEGRAHAASNRHACSDLAVGLVHGSDGSSQPQPELVALGSLASLKSVAKPPPGEKTIEDFASRPLTLFSTDSPRLCLTVPNVAASTKEQNREEGVDVAGDSFFFFF